MCGWGKSKGGSNRKKVWFDVVGTRDTRDTRADQTTRNVTIITSNVGATDSWHRVRKKKRKETGCARVHHEMRRERHDGSRRE